MLTPSGKSDCDGSSVTNSQRSIENEAAGFPGLMLLKPIVPLPGRHQICSIVFVRKGKTYLPDFVLTGWPKRESLGTSTICS